MWEEQKVNLSRVDKSCLLDLSELADMLKVDSGAMDSYRTKINGGEVWIRRGFPAGSVACRTVINFAVNMCAGSLRDGDIAPCTVPFSLNLKYGVSLGDDVGTKSPPCAPVALFLRNRVTGPRRRSWVRFGAEAGPVATFLRADMQQVRRLGLLRFVDFSPLLRSSMSALPLATVAGIELRVAILRLVSWSHAHEMPTYDLGSTSSLRW